MTALARFALLAVVFVDLIGQGLVFPIINALMMDPQQAFLPGSTPEATRHFNYGLVIGKFCCPQARERKVRIERRRPVDRLLLELRYRTVSQMTVNAKSFSAPAARSDRVSGYEPRGREFESLLPYLVRLVSREYFR